MAFSHDVQFWKLARLPRKKGRNRIYGVRWVVAGKSFSKWFEYEAQADSYRSRLIRAARQGEGFDTGIGRAEEIDRRVVARPRLAPRHRLGAAAAHWQRSPCWLAVDRFRQHPRRAAPQAPGQKGNPAGADPARAGPPPPQAP